jgi:GTPase KRas protein
MRTAQVFAVVFSLASQISFEEVPNFIEQILREKDQDFVPMVLVGYCQICQFKLKFW